MKLWGITNTGLVRSENQDAYAAFEAGGCTAAVVCDGMGGTHGGRVASAIAVACFQREIQNDLRADMTADQLRHVMLAAIAAANDAIRREAGRNADYRHMGTTLVCALARPDMALIANIGDSRCYLYRDGCLSRLSEDHTAVQRLIALSIIEPAEAKTHPERHRLTQHLGIFPDELIIQPHTVQLPVRPGDRFLLCSDGLTDMLEEEDLSALLRSQTAAPACAAALYQLAMQRGGKDNISVLLVGIDR